MQNKNINRNSEVTMEKLLWEWCCWIDVSWNNEDEGSVLQCEMQQLLCNLP